MKILKLFLIAALLCTAFLIALLKANKERNENPDLKEYVKQLNGHYIVKEDTLSFRNGKLYKKK